MHICPSPHPFDALVQRDECEIRLAEAAICKILNITHTNLGVIIYRVRNRLRECLEAKGVERE